MRAGDRQSCTSPAGEEKISGDDAREKKYAMPAASPWSR